MQQKILTLSIVIPTKDKPSSLINLLNALIIQTQNISLPYEIIVVDDDSERRNYQCILQYSLKHKNLFVIKNKGRGPASARNTGVSISKGDWILFLDDDVALSSDYVKNLVSLLNNASCRCYEGKVVLLDKYLFGPLTVGPTNTKGGVFLSANFLIKKELFLKAGGFDPSFPLPAYEDLDLASKIIKFSRISFSSEITVYHNPRKLDLKRCIFEGRTWEFIYLTARRYGYIGWEKYKTSNPLASIAYYSLVAVPCGRFIKSLKWFKYNPLKSMEGVLVSFANFFINTFYFLKLSLKIMIQSLNLKNNEKVKHRI